MKHLYWEDVEREVEQLCERMPPGVERLYGVPTGGSFVALLASKRTGLPVLDFPTSVDLPDRTCWVLDDLVDTGYTLRKYLLLGLRADALYRKPRSPIYLAPNAKLIDDWIEFPWEHEGGPVDAVTRLVEFSNDDQLVSAWSQLKEKERVVAGAVRELRMLIAAASGLSAK